MVNFIKLMNFRSRRHIPTAVDRVDVPPADFKETIDAAQVAGVASQGLDGRGRSGERRRKAPVVRTSGDCASI